MAYESKLILPDVAPLVAAMIMMEKSQKKADRLARQLSVEARNTGNPAVAPKWSPLGEFLKTELGEVLTREIRLGKTVYFYNHLVVGTALKLEEKYGVAYSWTTDILTKFIIPGLVVGGRAVNDAVIDSKENLKREARANPSLSNGCWEDLGVAKAALRAADLVDQGPYGVTVVMRDTTFSECLENQGFNTLNMGRLTQVCA